MSTPFLSELRILSFNYPPKGWAFCDGQILPINQNQALFSLLGTTYGGDGRINFGLPDLRARVPMHMGQGHSLGERGGEYSHVLTQPEMPAHTHPMKAKAASALVAGAAIPGSTKYVAQAISSATGHPLVQNFGTAGLALMSSASVSNAGGSQAHENQQPFLVLSFAIALQGIFPSQN